MKEWIKSLIAIIIILGAASSLVATFDIIATFDTEDEEKDLSLKSISTEGEISVEGSIPSPFPLFEIRGPTGRNFMRIAVGETYNGQTWKIENSDEGELYYENNELARVNKDFSEPHISTITPLIPVSNFVPIFYRTYRIENLENLRYHSEKETFTTPEIFKHSYRVYYDVYSHSEEILKSGNLSKNPQYFQLSESITENTKELARKITEKIENPYAKAKAIENYLKKTYTYDSGYERAPPDRDPVHWFLFNEKKGVCANFNSAFVILSRSVGIPSRVVYGFSLDPNEKYQIVNSDQSHLIAEVPFENIGWISFDATPSSPNSENKISTSTVIDEFDNVGIKGEHIKVQGSVKDGNGNPLKNMRVRIYLKEKRESEDIDIRMGTTDNEGTFNIRCKIDENIDVGYHWIIAQSLSSGIYKSSRSYRPFTRYTILEQEAIKQGLLDTGKNSKVKIFSKTEISISAPDSILAGEKFSIKGKLKEIPAEEKLGLQTIELSLGEKNWFLNTYLDGHFEIEESISKTGNYQLEAEFNGTGFYEESKASLSTEVSLIRIDSGIENYFVKGKEVRIFGQTVKENEKLEIVLENQVVATTRSEENGEFFVEFTVPESLGLGKKDITFRLSERGFSKSEEIFVYEETRITYSKNGEATLGEKFEINALITNKLGEPIAGEKILLSYNQENEINKVTKEGGKASFEISLPKEYEKNNFSFKLIFPKQGFHLSSETDGNFLVSSPTTSQKIVPWAILGIIIVVLAIGSIALRRESEENKTPQEFSKEKKFDKEIFEKRNNKEDPIKIEFPQIEKDLPKVWEVNEPLEILIRYKEKNEFSEKNKIKVYIDDKKRKSGSKKDLKLTHTFKKKEKHQIVIHAQIDEKSIVVTQDIRIVEYKEEIETLFNYIFDRLSESFDDLKAGATSSDLRKKISEIGSANLGELEALIHIFEFAKYSSHDVGRGDYTKFYRSWSFINKIVGGEE